MVLTMIRQLKPEEKTYTMSDGKGLMEAERKLLSVSKDFRWGARGASEPAFGRTNSAP